MPLDVCYSDDQVGVLYRTTGVLTLEDFAKAQAELHSDSERMVRHRYLLVDHTSVDSVQLSPAGIRELVSHTAVNSRIVSDACVAVAAPQVVLFGLARMWEVLDHSPYAKLVTRERARAIDWIEQQMLAKSVETDVRGFLCLPRK